MILGLVAAFGFAYVADWSLIVDYWAVVSAVLFSMLVGILFGCARHCELPGLRRLRRSGPFEAVTGGALVRNGRISGLTTSGSPPFCRTKVNGRKCCCTGF